MNFTKRRSLLLLIDVATVILAWKKLISVRFISLNHVQSFQIVSFVVMFFSSPSVRVNKSQWLNFEMIPFNVYVMVNVLFLIAAICLYCGIFRVKSVVWPQFPDYFPTHSKSFDQFDRRPAFESIHDYWTPSIAIFIACALRNRPNHLHRWQWSHQQHGKACEIRTDFSKGYASDRTFSRLMDMCVCKIQQLMFFCRTFSSHSHNSHRCLDICADANDLLFRENARIQETSTICTAFDAFNKSNIEFDCSTFFGCVDCVLFRARRRWCLSCHKYTHRVEKKIKNKRKESKCFLRSEVIT